MYVAYGSRHYFPQYHPQSKLRCISPLSHKKVVKATKLTGLSRMRAGQEMRIRSGKVFQRNSIAALHPKSLCFFWKALPEKKGAEKYSIGPIGNPIS